MDIILSLALEGIQNKVDVFKHNDMESAGILNVGRWNSEISIINFGQENILKFEKILYLNRIKYGIVILTLLACLLVTVLSCYLVHSYSVLEIKVKKRTKELKQTNEEIHEILNNLQDAVFIMDNHFIIQSRYSPATEKLLNVTNPQDKNCKEILFAKLDKTNEDISRHLFAFESVMNASEFQWDISNDDLLKTIPYFVYNDEDGSLIQKTLSLKYVPFFENNELKRMLIVASDLSEIIQLRQNFEQQQKSSHQKNVAINEIISADKKLVLDFFENAKKLIMAPLELMDKQQVDENFLNQVFRDLHTLKGNSRSLQLTQLGKMIHEVENQFVLFKSSGLKDEYNKNLNDLNKIFKLYYEIVEQIFHSGKNQDVPRIIVENVAKWLAQNNQDPKIIDEFLWNTLEDKIFSLIDFLKSFLDMVEEISQSTEKKVNLIFDVHNVYFKKDIFIAMRNSLTHILRNAIDHGLEAPSERKKNNKNESGRIWFEVNKNQKSLRFIIYDDGQGVVLPVVHSIAKNKGITNKEFVDLTKEEILEFLFLSGFSTKEDITELSGRGVGLDAVRAELMEVGIKVMMNTEMGKGSSFIFEIPLDYVCFLEEGQTLLTC